MHEHEVAPDSFGVVAVDDCPHPNGSNTLSKIKCVLGFGDMTDSYLMTLISLRATPNKRFIYLKSHLIHKLPSHRPIK